MAIIKDFSFLGKDNKTIDAKDNLKGIAFYLIDKVDYKATIEELKSALNRTPNSLIATASSINNKEIIEYKSATKVGKEITEKAYIILTEKGIKILKSILEENN